MAIKKDENLRAFAARIPHDLFRELRIVAAKEDISINMALCLLLEKGLEWEKYQA